MNKLKFTVEINGQKVDLAVVKPSHLIQQRAQLVYSKAFREALENKLMLRTRLEDYMREQNLWDDEKEKEKKALEKIILDGEKSLKKGGIKLSQAKKIAIDMRRARVERLSLLAKRNELDANTAEAYADQARFNYLVSACTVNGETLTPFFKDVDDYLSKTTESWTYEVAEKYAYLSNNIKPDFEAELPENKFLKEHKFVNDKLQFINKAGELIDSNGRRVNEDGSYINENGELIDLEGNLLTADGEYKFDFVPFEDDTTPAE